MRTTSTSNDTEDLVEELRVVLEKERTLRETGFNSEGVSDSEDTDLEDLEDYYKLSRSIKSLETYTTCLMDLLPSMEDTLSFANQANDEEQASIPLDFHVSGPSRTYILNIYDRFSKANQKLVERLGEANWQRHTALRNGPTKEAETVSPAAEETPKSVFIPVSLFQDFGLGSSLPAQTSYAATSASHTSFISSQADEEGGRLKVPPTPEAVSKGMPFICEICGQMLSQIKTRIDWKYDRVPSLLLKEDCLLTSLDDMFSQTSDHTSVHSPNVKMHLRRSRPGKCGKPTSLTNIVPIPFCAARFVPAAFQGNKERPISKLRMAHN